MIWKRLWGLNLKHKIKHFIWKCLNQTLPTNEAIAIRIGKGCNVCRRCGEEVETIEVQDSWKLFPIQWDGCLEHQWNFGRWWGKLQEAAHRNQGSGHIALTANFLWHLWKSRNEVCFNSKVQESHLIVTRAQQEWLEYEEIGKEERSQILDSSPTSLSRLPTVEVPGAMWVATCGAVDRTKKKAGIGIVVRDNSRKLTATKAIPLTFSGDRIVTKALAIRTGLLFAMEQQWASLEIQYECKSLIVRLNEEAESQLAVIIRHIKQLKASFWKCNFYLVSQHEERVSFKLAKFATKLIHDVKWERTSPLWLKQASQS